MIFVKQHKKGRWLVQIIVLIISLYILIIMFKTSTRIMARDLVRTRKHQKKFYEMKSQLQAVCLRLQTVKSTQAMAESMKGVAKVGTLLWRSGVGTGGKLLLLSCLPSLVSVCLPR